LIFIVFASAGVWVWAQSKAEIRLGSYAFVGRNKTVLIASVALLFIFMVAGSSILVLVGLCAIITAGHAIAHEIMLDPELESQTGQKMTGKVEETEDLASN
jgi:hypothetical protein